ncbi:MAG: hypothetical protein JNL80_11155 [Phycisphaerae bacterium]|nr:hypothetical protein [Phycisphaerae bacterium]
MLIYAGIDEAGYGPLLGPLCVACSVVAVEGLDPSRPDLRAPNLWERLKDAVCDSPSDKRKRIAIADSKRLKGAKEGKSHPLRHLERGVLSAVATERTLPATDDELFAALGVTVGPPNESPWYASVTPLPLALEADALAIAANRLRVAANGAAVRFARIACDALDGTQFNELAVRSQKSDMNFEMAMRHVNRIWSEHGQHHPRVVVDRHGGRMHYREPLQLFFTEASITIVAETDSLSRYRLEDRRGTITISFEVESESRHLPNALASMTAKFTRELFMERMNRFFRSHIAELKPTAGYVEDGRRYLKDITPTLRALGIASERLVRSR